MQHHVKRWSLLRASCNHSEPSCGPIESRQYGVASCATAADGTATAGHAADEVTPDAAKDEAAKATCVPPVLDNSSASKRKAEPRATSGAKRAATHAQPQTSSPLKPRAGAVKAPRAAGAITAADALTLPQAAAKPRRKARTTPSLRGGALPATEQPVETAVLHGKEAAAPSGAAFAPIDLSVSPEPAKPHSAQTLRNTHPCAVGLPSLTSVLMAKRPPAAIKAPYAAAMPPLHVTQHLHIPGAGNAPTSARVAIDAARLARATQHVSCAERDLCGVGSQSSGAATTLGSLLANAEAHDMCVAVLRCRAVADAHPHPGAAAQQGGQQPGPQASGAADAVAATGEWRDALIQCAATTAAACADSSGAPDARKSDDAARKLASELQARSAELQARRSAAATSGQGAAWVQKYAPACAAEVCGNVEVASNIVSWMRAFASCGKAASGDGCVPTHP